MIFVLILLFTVCWAQSPIRGPMPDLTDDAFQNECLSTTNHYRTIHQSPNFIIDNNAKAYAYQRCQLISQYKALTYGHKGVDGYRYGENQFWFGSGSNIVIPCSGAIDSWANEERFYNYSNPGFTHASGHFTQLVWKSSISHGCARCGGKGDPYYETYIVCIYYPPGNYPTTYQFETNVLPPDIMPATTNATLNAAISTTTKATTKCHHNH